MSGDSRSPSRDTRPLLEKATHVVRKLRNAGHEAYFAGGCVRDMVMERTPKDYDIATSAVPDEVVGLFSRTLALGAQFGVILVRYGGEGFEVATFRSDASYTDGRRPDAVTFVSAEEDVRRRDFTINGLLFDPLAQEMHDHVGGVEDIAAGIVRAIGDPVERFNEDRLRLLRAVRFAARLDFILEDHTRDAIVAHAPAIGEVSSERIREELCCILSEGGAQTGMRLLEELGLLRHVLPEISGDSGLPASDIELLDTIPIGDDGMGFALLLRGLGSAGASEVGRRLRMSNAEVSRIGALIEGVEDLATLDTRDRVAMIRFVRTPNAVDILVLGEILASLSPELGSRIQACRDLLEETPPEDLRPPPLLTGHDLQALGHAPSPTFKVVLQLLEDAQLRGEVTDREAAEALVSAFFESD